MARPRTEPANRTATAIRFRPELHAELVAIARERDLSLNWLVNRAVERYLADLPPMPDEPARHVHDWCGGRADGRVDPVGRSWRHCRGCGQHQLYQYNQGEFVDREP